MATAAPSPIQLRALPERRPELALAHVRLMLLMLLFVGATAMIGLRIAYLAVFADNSTNRAHISAIARGDILDRNGIPLAQTIEAWSIGVHPEKVIGDKRALAISLAQLMPERSAAEYLKILNSKLTFTYLRRRATPELVAAVNRLGEPGIDLGREPERIYPQGMLAAHVLGFTNFDGQGVSGMEKVLESELTGSARGTGVMLSIDSRVQQALEAELGAAMAKFSAIGAAGVVMDIQTGEVVALTSMPELNPNKPAQQGPDAAFNRATLGVYELGSTFKPFTVAMAMDDGIITSFGQTYNCPRVLQAGRFSITDTHPFGGSCTVAQIMQESSNIGTAQIAAQVGAARQREWLRRMHFLEKVSIELPERGRPLTPGANWGDIATMTVGYGHGIAVSPLHLATGYATLFNGGFWRPATLLKHDAGRPVPKGERVFSAETSYKMRALLRLVVMKGTGRKADAPGYRVGGKTGTAEKIVGGRYTSGSVVTTFAGVFPMEAPRYVVVAMLDDPKATKDTYGFHTAGWNVAPVISGVISRIGPMLGVMPDPNREANMAEVLPYIHEKEE
ncbi:penicillin-binding protein 2 [Sphingomonas sp. MAH-20]|uniref:Penicillin-binding protein 2 n=1 Tax=Sphingomonas horti TaxID=2682842 RepID=A0A6I4J2N1_9SPHN|nr:MULTISPECIES: penicillin-binding protein 2 [Sphingomonas]MBA2918654.1 penicillin-binding protein 2 [Sphingomonas sp. CGMCC 1.13658]MVO78685.1 penicillin-binding protein 2 [Sphingomonas horti]